LTEEFACGDALRHNICAGIKATSRKTFVAQWSEPEPEKGFPFDKERQVFP
jgi:hypothetical protein